MAASGAPSLVRVAMKHASPVLMLHEGHIVAHISFSLSHATQTCMYAQGL